MNFIAFDAGGSFIKYGIPKSLHFFPLPYTKEIILNIINENGSKNVLLTGAGSQIIKNWLSPSNDKKVVIHQEFQATGFGGAYLSDLDECIVVNIGSGTPILYVNRKDKKVIHLGGTGLGSASIVGLSHFITQIDELDKISSLALQGNAAKVNLLVGDLYENSLKELGLPASITASNFGKYQNWRHIDEKPSINDLLAGLHVLVAETIAVITFQASKTYTKNHSIPIVITGGGTLNEALTVNLKKTFKFLNDIECIVPQNALYGTLHGLFVLENLI